MNGWVRMIPNRYATLQILCIQSYFPKYVIMGLGEIMKYFRDNLDLSTKRGLSSDVNCLCHNSILITLKYNLSLNNLLGEKFSLSQQLKLQRVFQCLGGVEGVQYLKMNIIWG